MKKQMESLEKKKILVSNFHTDSTRVQFEQLLALLEQLSTVHINGLLLKSTGIVKTLQAIQKNVTEAFSVELVNKATELISNWKLQITTEEKRTNQNYKGGKIAIIPSSKDEIPCPETISNVLWEKLRGAYNVSQLYAISYVVQKLDERHDTRVALIQGPPGTGKTSTILGLVSALLHASKSKQQNTERKANNEQDSDNLEAESNSSSSSTVEPKVTTLKRRLLICAPSNAAIDEVLTRIKLTGIYDDAQHSFFHGVNASNSERRPVKLVRLGEPLEGASTVVQQLVLENQVEASIKQKAEYHRLQEAIHILKEAQYNVEEYRKEHPEVRNYVPQRQGANNTNQPPEDKLSNSYKHLKELLGLVNHYKRERDESAIALDMLRNRTRVEVLVDAEVVGTTLSSSGKNQFIDYIIQQNITFETVIIDEAGQTTEPGTLLPLRFGCKNLILVGDPRQLPATVNSRFAEANGLGRSLFERLEQAEHEVVMLTVQYRMHPEIRSFPSAQFYQNKLTDGPHITKEVEDIKNIVMEGSVVSTMLNTLQIPPVIFFDSCKKTYLQGNMAGLNNNDIMENKEGNSFRNVYECEQIIHLLAILLPKLKGKLSIAIISPYKEQVNMILQKCKQHSQIGYEMKQRVDESNRIEINSVDGFQGREKDVVIFSSVRCNNIVSPHVPKVIGFLADERRLNVAITRAKKSLIIFGNSATLSVDKMWMNMIQSLEERNAIRHGREGLYKLPASL